MSLEYSAWTEEGTAREALAALCSRADVLTEEFHRVYARVLADEELLREEPAARFLLEQILHADDPVDTVLMKSGRISTVLPSEEFSVPEEVLLHEGTSYDIAGRRAWVAQNRNLPETLRRLSERHARGYF